MHHIIGDFLFVFPPTDMGDNGRIQRKCFLKVSEDFLQSLDIRNSSNRNIQLNLIRPVPRKGVKWGLGSLKTVYKSECRKVLILT